MAKMAKENKNEREKIGKKKQMMIVLKSKPKASDRDISTQSVSKANLKRRDARQKGTRGPSWIG